MKKDLKWNKEVVKNQKFMLLLRMDLNNNLLH